MRARPWPELLGMKIWGTPLHIRVAVLGWEKDEAARFMTRMEKEGHVV